VYLKTLDLGGPLPDSPLSFLSSEVRTVADAATTLTIHMPEYHPAWLVLLFGCGRGCDTTSTKVVLTNTRTTQVTKAQSVELDVHFHLMTPQQRLIVELWYDNVFGTWAFRELPQCVMLVSGVARDAKGRPAAGQKVSLQSGGSTFTTVTDPAGNYSFFACHIKPGAASLMAQNVRTPLQIQRVPVRQDLRLP